MTDTHSLCDKKKRYWGDKKEAVSIQTLLQICSVLRQQVAEAAREQKLKRMALNIVSDTHFCSRLNRESEDYKTVLCCLFVALCLCVSRTVNLSMKASTRRKSPVWSRIQTPGEWLITDDSERDRQKKRHRTEGEGEVGAERTIKK